MPHFAKVWRQHDQDMVLKMGNGAKSKKTSSNARTDVKFLSVLHNPVSRLPYMQKLAQHFW